MTIDALQVWSNLEKGAGTIRDGMVVLRVIPESNHNVWLGIDRSTGSRAVVIELADTVHEKQFRLPTARGFDCRLVRRDNGHIAIVVSSQSARHRGIFAHIVDDVVEQITLVQEKTLVPGTVRDRLVLWQSFLKSHSPEGLTLEEQIGLFGELCTLQSIMIPSLGAARALAAWAGPAGGVHDFKSDSWALEVKASTGSDRLVSISSEGQLDDTGLEALHLIHVTLNTVSGGQALPDLVAGVRATVAGDLAAADAFERCLFAAGYTDAHADRYLDARYSVRYIISYRIVPGFPRLVASSLPRGVRFVNYRLDVGECDRFRVSADQLVISLKASRG